MRIWATAVVTVGMASVGIAGLAAPAQAGHIVGKGSVMSGRHHDVGMPSAAERVAEARESAQAKIDKLTKKAKKFSSEDLAAAPNLRELNAWCSSELAASKREEYTGVVDTAEAAYTAAAQAAEDTYTAASLQQAIRSKRISDVERARQTAYRLHVGYQATLHAAADAYIAAVSPHSSRSGITR